MSETMELLPCPFCGTDKVAVCQSERVAPVFWVECIMCNAEAQPSTVKAEAIAAWNTRTPATPAQPHVNETPKSEHDARDVLTAQPAGDAELIASLRLWNRDDAADRIEQLAATCEALTAERDDAVIKRAAWELEAKTHQAARARAEADLAKAVEALELAANRLSRRAVDYIPGGRLFIETGEWADEARATLARIKEKRT